MRQFLRETKSSIYHQLKYGRFYIKGFAHHYATRQETESTIFSHLWDEKRVSIRIRGRSAEENERRIWNMQLAANCFNGLIIEPGQVVGFWQRVPAPRLHNQFKQGPTLINGVVTNDVGGGLCQISTALYALFLWCGFEVIERHNHSIDAYGDDRYFILGQDATVAYGYKDLVVRNNSAMSLCLQVHIDTEDPGVLVRLLGSEPMPHTISIDTNILEKLPIQNGDTMPGWRVETVRKKTGLNNGSATVDFRYTDTYRPHGG